MQSSNIQKDKVDLTEWIAQLEDKTIIEQLKQLMHATKTQDDFMLPEKQIMILEEGTTKYESGEERPYSWYELKNKTVDTLKLSEEQKNEVREAVLNYFSGKDKGYTWEEVQERAIRKFNEKKA